MIAACTPPGYARAWKLLQITRPGSPEEQVAAELFSELHDLFVLRDRAERLRRERLQPEGIQ